MTTHRFTIEEKPYEVEIVSITGPLATVVVNGKTYAVTIESSEPIRVSAPLAPQPVPVVTAAPARPHVAREDGGKNWFTRSPMPGLVLKINVAEGQKVSKGETVVVLDAMKMENNLIASRSGTVKKVHVRQGQDVADETVLVEYVT